MAKKRKGGSSEILCDAIVKGMQEKKAADILIMDLRKVKNAVADFFVLCSGSSDKQLDAIADSVDQMVYKLVNENPWHIEGKNNKEWMLLDYFDVVAHIFRHDRREYFALEKLWGDAEMIEVNEAPGTNRG
jgi:ribosome-associated protein